MFKRWSLVYGRRKCVFAGCLVSSSRHYQTSLNHEFPIRFIREGIQAQHGARLPAPQKQITYTISSLRLTRLSFQLFLNERVDKLNSLTGSALSTCLQEAEESVLRLLACTLQSTSNFPCHVSRCELAAMFSRKWTSR